MCYDPYDIYDYQYEHYDFNYQFDHHAQYYYSSPLENYLNCCIDQQQNSVMIDIESDPKKS